MKEIIEEVKEDLKETYKYFKNDEHFDEVFEQAGWGEDEMRLFDCGYIKGMQNVLNKLEELHFSYLQNHEENE